MAASDRKGWGGGQGCRILLGTASDRRLPTSTGRYVINPNCVFQALQHGTDIVGLTETTGCFKSGNAVFGIILWALVVSGMTDPDGRDESVPWIADRPQRPDGQSDSPQLNVISDRESNTVTFVSNRPENDTTAAWVTADVDVLVDLSEAR